MMPCIAGIDVGSLHTPSFVAWLDGRRFALDSYQATENRPLPEPPSGLPPPSVSALDAPQGLPRLDEAVRKADREANTPTRRLPDTRQKLNSWKLYGGLVRAGVLIFWSAHHNRLATIFGLEDKGASQPTVATDHPLLAETYPRFVLRQLWPGLEIPSKRKEPVKYVDAVWSRLHEVGYECSGVVRPTVDQVDAMLCALAAYAVLEGSARIVGCPPVIDEEEHVLREGWIASPSSDWLRSRTPATAVTWVH